MGNSFDFFKMAFDMKCVDINYLRQIVITSSNPFGYISKDEFKTISGEDFEKKVEIKNELEKNKNSVVSDKEISNTEIDNIQQ